MPLSDPSWRLSPVLTPGSRASFVGLTILALLLAISAVTLGNTFRDGFPALYPSGPMPSFEMLHCGYRNGDFYLQALPGLLSAFVVLGIPVLLAILFGITLHRFYLRCLTNRSRLSIIQTILLMARSLAVFPVTAFFILLAISWPTVQILSARLLWYWSPGTKAAGEPKNLLFMDDLLLVAIWYFFLPWPGNCALRLDSSGWKTKRHWEIADSVRKMPISRRRLLSWLPAGLGLLTWVAYRGPQIEYSSVEITLLASAVLADYLVVTLRVVPFLQAQTVEPPGSCKEGFERSAP